MQSQAQLSAKNKKKIIKKAMCWYLNFQFAKKLNDFFFSVCV